MCEAVGGCNPVVAAARDEQIKNLSVRQTVRDCVVYKLVTIKSREPVVSAEPEIAARIGNDLVNAIARQTIGSRIGSDRKLFGAASRSRNENQYDDGKRSLHGAYDSRKVVVSKVLNSPWIGSVPPAIAGGFIRSADPTLHYYAHGPTRYRRWY